MPKAPACRHVQIPQLIIRLHLGDQASPLAITKSKRNRLLAQSSVSDHVLSLSLLNRDFSFEPVLGHNPHSGRANQIPEQPGSTNDRHSYPLKQLMVQDDSEGQGNSPNGFVSIGVHSWFVLPKWSTA